MALSPGASFPHGIITKNDLLKQVGVKERLLCVECEGKFSRWEAYARRFLYGTSPGKIEKIDPGIPDHVNPNPVIEGARRVRAEYKPFKLFLLSLLWRVSVSETLFCRPVNIGRFEKNLRRMLLNENPGGQFDYPCMLTDLRLPNSTMMDYIERPSSGFVDGIDIVRLIMGGYIWWFMYSGAPKSSPYTETFMNDNGDFLVLIDSSGMVAMQFRDALVQAGRILPQFFHDMPKSERKKGGH